MMHSRAGNDNIEVIGREIYSIFKKNFSKTANVSYLLAQ